MRALKINPGYYDVSKNSQPPKKGSPVKRIMDEDLQLSTGTDGLLKFLEASKNLIANLSYKVPILHNL